jgi:probable phosphomutase (TIGR03848 family)
MTVILLRHGRSTSNTAHTLAGRSDGVDLDDKGLDQAQAIVERLAGLPIRAIVRSPLLRCRRTVEPLAAALGLAPVVDERISEVDYGSWTGRNIGDLVKEPLWAVVQQQPSAAVFPAGEGLAHVQARAVAAIREHDRKLAELHEGDALWVACTHGDVIKSVVADALGTHLDSFQRITADPASMSVIRYVRSSSTSTTLVLRSPPDCWPSRRRRTEKPTRRTARCRRKTLWSAARPIECPTAGRGMSADKRCRYFGGCHDPRNSRLPHTRPLRRRDCRAAG